jgi:hypothetical protein
MMKNIKQNIYIRPYILQNSYILPYKYKQQYQKPYQQQLYQQQLYQQPYQQPKHKYNYSIIPVSILPLQILSTSYNYNPRYIYKSIITYKHNKIIITTTISSFIIYKILYCYIIYFHMNTLFDL